jgi:hypothetical protein
MKGAFKDLSPPIDRHLMSKRQSKSFISTASDDRLLAQGALEFLFEPLVDAGTMKLVSAV